MNMVQLLPGFYRLKWAGKDEYCLAAVGRLSSGTNWYAPIVGAVDVHSVASIDWDRVEKIEKISIDATEDVPIQNTFRALVDWVYLFATEGEAWPSSARADALIALAKARKPTQNDAEVMKLGVGK